MKKKLYKVRVEGIQRTFTVEAHTETEATDEVMNHLLSKEEKLALKKTLVMVEAEEVEGTDLDC